MRFNTYVKFCKNVNQESTNIIENASAFLPFLYIIQRDQFILDFLRIFPVQFHYLSKHFNLILLFSDIYSGNSWYHKNSINKYKQINKMLLFNNTGNLRNYFVIQKNFSVELKAFVKLKKSCY